ncbi:MAG: hypothetical protein M3552_03735, partial [Planctomycetota bacterium]|nr:hypothetical protein [Planctomycetota bacterium]
MTIHFHCGCGQKLKASAESIGKHFDCPVCGTAVVVPETDAAAPAIEKPAAVAAAAESPSASVKSEKAAAAPQQPHVAKVAKHASVAGAKKKGSKSATNGSHKSPALSDDDVALAALGLT